MTFFIEKWGSERWLKLHPNAHSVQGRIVVIRKEEAAKTPVSMLIMLTDGTVENKMFKDFLTFKKGFEAITGSPLAVRRADESYSIKHATTAAIGTILKAPSLKRHAKRITVDIVNFNGGSFEALLKKSDSVKRKKKEPAIRATMGTAADGMLMDADDFYARDDQLGMY